MRFQLEKAVQVMEEARRRSESPNYRGKSSEEFLAEKEGKHLPAEKLSQPLLAADWIDLLGDSGRYLATYF